MYTTVQQQQNVMIVHSTDKERDKSVDCISNASTDKHKNTVRCNKPSLRQIHSAFLG